ncbi:hypothetical protein M422DRAFT_273338, partial [Sphaerobolus stellatus SS14]
YVVITEGTSSPFVGIILTGFVHVLVGPEILNSSIGQLFAPAKNVDPLRWGHLDPGYITSPSEDTRAVFYGPNGSFDPTISNLDFLTKDVGSTWPTSQVANIFTPTKFQGSVTAIIGGLDKTAHCPCDSETYQLSEKFYFPDADFNMIVIEGQGHSLNLDFGALQLFPLMLDIFDGATKDYCPLGVALFSQKFGQGIFCLSCD